MSRRVVTFFLLLIIAGALFMGWFFSGVRDAEVQRGTQTITFLIAHQPTAVFDEANLIFSNELERLSNGRLKLKVVTPSDVGFGAGDVPKDEVYALMDAGVIQLSSMPTSAFREEVPQTDIFSMPFLFRNYETIDTFFTSSDGDAILASVSDATRVEALAFTFSGGFRVFALFNSGVQSVEDLRNASIVSSGGDVTGAIFDILKLHLVSPENVSLESVDGVEVAYSRFSALPKSTSVRTVIETGHRLLVTMIVADDTFMDTLSVEDREALKTAVRLSAEKERESSRDLTRHTRMSLQELGVSIIEVSEEERVSLREKAREVFTQFEDRVSPSMLSRIFAL